MQWKNMEIKQYLNHHNQQRTKVHPHNQVQNQLLTKKCQVTIRFVIV